MRKISARPQAAAHEVPSSEDASEGRVRTALSGGERPDGPCILSSAGLGKRQLRAVMKKNIMMKRRRPLQTLTEILSPMLFVLVVVAFFDISKIQHNETTIFAAQTYDVAGIAGVLRGLATDFPESDNDLIDFYENINEVLLVEGLRTVLTLDEYVWIHLALRSFIGKELLDTASDLLSRVEGGHWWNLFRLGHVIISPDTPETLMFRQWMNKTYRFWSQVEGKVFDTLEEAATYRDGLKEREDNLKNQEEDANAVDGDIDRVWAHLHFDKLDFTSNQFEVRIRMQHSVLPNTEEPIKEFARGVEIDSNQYHWSGFLSLQRAVELFVANRTHALFSSNEAEDFAQDFISGVATSIDAPGGAAASAAIGYASQYLSSGVSSTDILSAVSPEVLVEFVEDISGLRTLLNGTGLDATTAVEAAMGLPSSPHTFSLADDWSAPFPTLAWEVSQFYSRFGYITGLIMACAVIFPVSQLILIIVQEKEIRMKEMMKIMGLREWVFNVSWLVTYTAFFFLQALAQATYMSFTVFGKADFSLVLIFIFFFNMTLISLAFIISTFFNRAKLASMLGPIVVFCMVVPAYIFTFYETFQFVPVKKALSLLAPTAYALGLDRIIAYERNSVGLSWSNMDEGNMSFQFTLGMLVFDFFLYCFIAWYLDKVLPTKYGHHESPFFIIRPAFWSRTCGAWVKRLTGRGGGAWASETSGEGSIEQQLERVKAWDPKQPSVEIKDLTKVYGGIKRKVAVKGISLEMMHGQVTCLLGTNGAGKSSTISMLSGLHEVTSGDSYIYGESIVRNISSVRKIMGVCPQHNVLYPDLTVREHLEFFAALKGVKDEYLDREVFNMVNDCELSDKIDVQTARLSGGQKRKLSLAISLIGDSKIVFLDEPSAGMDVQSRRSMMELLLRQKMNRTIILTTHHLEEADLLGDRVAIMKDGTIACVDSPLELKLKYGLGYVMVMTKTDHAEKNVDALCDYVKSTVPSARLLTNSAGEVSFQLPSSENRALVSLFSDIEPRLAEFNINSYGIAMTSLEDVFLSVAEETEEKGNGLDPLDSQDTVKGSNPTFSRGRAASSDREWDVESGEVSYRAQLWQVIKKRIIALRRDRGSIFHEIFMPLIVVTSVLFILSIKPQGAGPPLQLSAGALLPGFRFDTKINSKNEGGSWYVNALDQSSAELPEAFSFQRAQVNNPESSMTSPYFERYMALFDHNCETSICLSWRNLMEQESMAQADRFSDIDTKRKKLEMCSYRVGDKAFVALNFGDIAGFTDEDRESVLAWVANELDTTPEIAVNTRFDALLDKQLAAFLDTPIAETALDGIDSATGLRSWFANLIGDVVARGSDAGESVAGGVSSASSSVLAKVQDWLTEGILALTDTSWLQDAVVDLQNPGSLLFGLSSGDLLPLVFRLYNSTGDFGESIILSLLPENSTARGREALDELIESLNERVNGTELLDENRTLANLTIEDLLDIFDEEADRYYRARACEASVTLADIKEAFGIDNITETFGLGSEFTKFADGENVLCAAVNSGYINLAMAALFVQEFGLVNEEDLAWSLVDDLRDYVPKQLSFSSLFPGDVLDNLRVWELFDFANIFEDGFAWFEVPNVEDLTMRELLESLGIDVVGDGGLISEWIAGSNFAGIASRLTFGTLVGVQAMNFTIPIPMSTLYTATSGHAKPACLNEMAEARLRVKTRNTRASFKVWNHPFETLMKDNVKRVVWLAFFAVLFTLVPFCYNPACYGMHAVQERVSHAKHLLFVSGLGYKTYWLGNLIFDFACYMVVAVWTLFCFAISGAIEFADDRSSMAMGTSCLFLAYGLASIPQAYCLSFLFNDDSTAQIVISLFNFLTGWMFTVTAVSLDIYKLTEMSAMMRRIFRWFPAFNLGEGLIAATEESITRSILENDEEWDVYSWEILGRNLVVLCLLSLFYFTLLVFIEWLMGNVRVSKSIGKFVRGLSKYRGKKQSKSTIMPMHVADRADELREEVANNEPVYEFSDDESSGEEDDKNSSAVQSASGVKLDRLYGSSKAPEKRPAEGLEQYNLEDMAHEEIMAKTATQKLTEGGVLRRMDSAGAEGFEFEPHGAKSAKKFRHSKYIYDEDEDVRIERRRVYQSASEDVLQLKLLRKVFANIFTGRKHVAVRQLTLGIKPGECFGFLGTNGAGKTTTMKMITREHFPSEGKILLRGKSIFNYSSSRDIGYCPQFDALFPRLTASEHLHIYANIKGVPSTHVTRVVEHLLDACDLRPFANVISSTYSGGTKRKLSIAIALIGKPDVVLLDEPSAGVDPAARRRIWEIICSSMSESRSIVLTSHSMEECEALCDRVSIMAAGVMRCIGPSLHLKRRFCSGYEVQIRTESLQDCVRAVGYIEHAMRATVKEQYGPQATLSVPFEGNSLSLIFKTLENNRRNWGLSSYGVSQSSLEQVFMNIANKYNVTKRMAAQKSTRSMYGSSSMLFGFVRRR